MQYAALGDSMSIDDYAGGPGRGAASLLFRNRASDFPEWVGRDIAARFPGARFLPVATDGALAATVRYAQLPRLRDVGARPSVVTLTVGGNDLLQTFGNDEATGAALRALREHGQAILSALREMSEPDAAIVVSTIYDPSDGTGDAGRLTLLPWPTALDWIARFNQTLRTLANEHGALVADIHGHFLGHGLRAGDPSQNDPRPINRELWYRGVIEPNAWGASEIRRVFWETLEGAGAWPQFA
jgi:lysophospholipase L1-like esterase